MLIISENKNTLQPTQGLDKTFFITAATFEGDNWKNKLIEQLEKSPNNHLLFLEDFSTLDSSINICECIGLMERTFAYTFHLQDKNASQALQNYVQDGVYAWQFKYNKNINPKTFDYALYRKKDFIFFLKKLKNTKNATPRTLKQSWSLSPCRGNNVGLAFN